MPNERRYRDDEVEEILDLAVRSEEGRVAPTSSQHGLSLGEIQEIGREAGIEAERIAEAAAVVESRREVLPPRTWLGMPVSVGRMVDLPRALTDREWDILVADLRDTFGATGRVGAQGGAKEWRNGNLRVLLEPTESGHRLRLSTLHGRATAASRFGVVFIIMALVMAVVLVPDLIAAAPASWRAVLQALLPQVILGGGGIAMLAWSRATLPGWALEREAQMERIAARARSMAADTELLEER